MNVGMILHLPPPGMQYCEKARHITAHVFFIGGELFHGFRGCFEKRIVGRPLVTANEKPDLLGHGEGDHEMMARHLPLRLAVHPFQCFLALAVGAVPVAAGPKHVMDFAAVGTLINRGSTGGCSA